MFKITRLRFEERETENKRRMGERETERDSEGNEVRYIIRSKMKEYKKLIC